MKSVHLSLRENSHNIVVGHRILSKLGQGLKNLRIGKDAIIITNSAIRRLHGKTLEASLKRSGFTVKVFVVPDSEKSKSAKMALSLIEKIARYDVMKKVFVVAFGGGVVGDLAGYVAAAYKRGVPYVQVPTSFLAQIDSAIGGKVAIDLPFGKNYVGAFYQPKIVWSDIALLSTLSQRQLRNGLAEVVKYGVISNRSLFEYIERNYAKLLRGDRNVLEHVVLTCSRIKAGVVQRDEKETKGLRTILNFGHTIGHAIEAAGKYSSYQHGEAITLGMRVAASISHQLKLFSQDQSDRLNRLLTDIGLPKNIRKVRMLAILRVMKYDKKFGSGKNRFVLATKIGRVRVVEGVPLTVIQKAIRQYI